jgi:hypothetical protein
LLSAAQVAVSEHNPVPLVIVTRLPTTEQAPAAVMTAVVDAFVVVETIKVEPNTALAGTPVKVTVGDAFPTV